MTELFNRMTFRITNKQKETPEAPGRQYSLEGEILDCFKLPCEEDGLVDQLQLLPGRGGKRKSSNCQKTKNIYDRPINMGLDGLTQEDVLYMSLPRRIQIQQMEILIDLSDKLYSSCPFSFKSLERVQNKAKEIICKSHNTLEKFDKVLYKFDIFIAQILINFSNE